ncbi:hypothetical protein UFOVP314_11 [uncultured Caudovirales phage]|uniref:Uncharacterized protein n=1 Tax=uncultured Caudovirales phage TaxID=2100421 RepID=A0A6J5LSY2_9CAUD|nr:hypothetical protein UFOVP314_11 [uncultured Caudovirales phage]
MTETGDRCEAGPRMMQSVWPAPHEGRTHALDADQDDCEEVGPGVVGRYRLRPIAVEAIQYRPDIPNCDQVAQLLGDNESGCTWGDQPHDDTYWADGEIEPGDWVIKAGTGDYLVMSAEQFSEQYESQA